MINKSNNISLFYGREDDLIYRKEIDINITFYILKKMYPLFAVLKDIFDIIHDVNKHFDFDRIYKQIMFVDIFVI